MPDQGALIERCDDNTNPPSFVSTCIVFVLSVCNKDLMFDVGCPLLVVRCS